MRLGDGLRDLTGDGRGAGDGFGLGGGQGCVDTSDLSLQGFHLEANAGEHLAQAVVQILADAVFEPSADFSDLTFDHRLLGLFTGIDLGAYPAHHRLENKQQLGN